MGVVILRLLFFSRKPDERQVRLAPRYTVPLLEVWPSQHSSARAMPYETHRPFMTRSFVNVRKWHNVLVLAFLSRAKRGDDRDPEKIPNIIAAPPLSSRLPLPISAS